MTASPHHLAIPSVPHVDETINSISIVVPVYCGAQTLPELFERIAKVLTTIEMHFEVIFVNDASPDDSWNVIESLAAADNRIRGIDLMKNAGQHRATLCGIRQARHSMIATMDDDLQHPPEHLPALIRKLREGYDLVYGNPLQEPRGYIRNMLSKGVKRAILTYGAHEDISISSFRLFRSSLRQAFASHASIQVYLDLMLSWGASTIGEVRIPHATRRVGASTYTLGRLIRHALTMLTSYSVTPLHVASVVGFSMVLFGILILGVTLLDFVFRGRVAPGFTFLSSLLVTFSGTQLFAIGILGLYLARMYEGMLGRPPYIVRNMTSRPTSSFQKEE